MKLITAPFPGCVLALLLATACVSHAGMMLKEMATGLTSPMVLTSLPDGSGRILVADQIGKVHVMGKDGALRPQLFADLTGKMIPLRNAFDERGLLGLALHPQFNQNRRLFVYYSAPPRPGAPAKWDHTSHISEFKVPNKEPLQLDLASERVILQIDEPQFNHNGGRIAFGPDGFLYIAMGDGGNANDAGLGHGPEGNAQDVNVLLGKILRIDIDKGTPYGIPQDNPFAKGGGRPEIFAWGIRNPWGISFDRGGKRELFAADVGQSMYEEVNIIVKGGNYGWNKREGFIGFNPENPIKPPEEAPAKAKDGKPFIDPIVAYKNFKGHPGDSDIKGISVTGGYVYRGKALPQLTGKYIFGDWSRNWGVADGVVFMATRPSDPKVKEWTLEALPLDNFTKGRL
ncbi:MAG: PQQ-dependent sugar dehydrogenase, partial [Verrucomicrobiota bacterium]